MASPEKSYLEYDANRARRVVDRQSPVVAVPWALAVTVDAGERQRVNFLNVTRSIAIASDEPITVAFSSSEADPDAATEVAIAAGVPFSEQVQVTGLWLVNRGAATAAVSVFAVLGPDPSDGWPVYSAAAGFDAIDETPTLPAAVALPV